MLPQSALSSAQIGPEWLSNASEKIEGPGKAESSRGRRTAATLKRLDEGERRRGKKGLCEHEGDKLGGQR